MNKLQANSRTFNDSDEEKGSGEGYQIKIFEKTPQQDDVFYQSENNSSLRTDSNVSNDEIQRSNKLEYVGPSLEVQVVDQHQANEGNFLEFKLNVTVVET